MTFGPVVNARFFAEETAIQDAPPLSSSTAGTTRTQRDPEFDLEELEASFIAKPAADDPLLQRIRASRSDISSAKLKMYHDHCNKRLEHTMQLFRLREERERVSISRGSKKQRVGGTTNSADAFSASTNFESRDRQWKLIRESNDVRVYRHIRRKQRTSTMMASGTIHGSLSDVMNGLYADTTKDSQVLHTLLSNKFLDAGVLHVDRHGDGGGDDHEQFQFSGITWTALKTPGLFFCKNRDFLCFKKMDCFKDDFGDDFGYLVLQSIDPSDECSRAIQSKASRYVRGYISIGIIFKKQDDDLVSMYVHGEFNPKGRISSAFGDASFASSIIALANTAQSGQAKNLSMLLHSFSAAPGVMASQFFSKDGKDRCGVCARSMFFWDAPQHCRGCWQRTCRSCRVKKPIFCDHYHRSHQGKKSQTPCTETFCLQCVASVIPSGVQTKAKLLKQLEKKRKRSSGSGGHRQTISSSITDSVAIRAAYQASIAHPDDDSSISAMSFQESEKLQQHRLSLTKGGPAGRRTPRQRLSSMVDVVEHFETTQYSHFGRPYIHNASGGASSSIPSLVSFSSNDAGTISDYGGTMLTASSNTKAGGNNAMDFRVGSRQYHTAMLAAGLKRDSLPRDDRYTRGGGGAGNNHVAATRTPRTDEYYQKVLQRYLRSNRSYISMNSNQSSALTNGSSNHRNALTDREDVSTVRSAVGSVSTGSAASIASADIYFKRL